MHSLHVICGRQAPLPRSFGIPVCYDLAGDPLCHGGFADVWKGQHQGRDVAAKVLRVYSKDGSEMVRRVGCQWCSQLVMWTNDLTIPRVEVLQGSCDVESPPPSKHTTTTRCNDDGYSIRDGVGMDGKREHKRVH